MVANVYHDDEQSQFFLPPFYWIRAQNKIYRKAKYSLWTILPTRKLGIGSHGQWLLSDNPWKTTIGERRSPASFNGEPWPFRYLWSPNSRCIERPTSGNKIRWGGTADDGRTPKKESRYQLCVHTINLHKYVWTRGGPMGTPVHVGW